jgi:hypothetical protein
MLNALAYEPALRDIKEYWMFRQNNKFQNPYSGCIAETNVNFDH